MKLLVATGNQHKLREIQEILHLPGLEVIGLAGFPDAPEVIEDGDTFHANAVKKAVTIAAAGGLWSLADDSGLEVDALGGQPGVRSARYAGEPADYAANNRKLLAAMGGRTDRSARFRCAIALASPDSAVRVVEGKCEGHIVETARGEAGFGYDPLFVPDGYQQTFAEMDAGLKNRLSHRGRALELAAAEWGGLLADLGQA